MALPTTLTHAASGGDYEKFETTGNKSVYFDTLSHTDSSQDLVEFTRAAPKPRGNFLGVRRSGVRTAKDHTVLQKDGTDTVAPVVLKTDVSRPVGVSDTDFNKMLLAHCYSLLGLPEAYVSSDFPAESTLAAQGQLSDFYSIGEI